MNILITGVTRGLGLAMARGFIAAGHTVIGSGRSPDPIAALRAEYPDHYFDIVDVADLDSVSQWRETISSSIGTVDILVNNAAIINANAPLWEVPPEDFSSLIDINVKGVFHVVQQFMPLLLKQNRGMIVNFSSGWGRSVSAEVASYCASKFAVEGLTQALALDLPAGIAAVALNPGIIHTRMLDSCFGSEASDFGTPTEWAKRAVPYILGLTAANNGESLTVP